MTDLAAHWENVYTTKDPAAVSWYRPHLERSLAFVEAARLAPGAHVLDVGGGASTLVDDLVARGLSVTVLDLSPTALARSRERLGPRAEAAHFVAADVLTSGISQGSVDLWHDRAVLHFLRDDADRARYRARLLDALAPRGHVVLGGFALDGPEKCSGLPVCRASADELMAFLGEPFEELGRAAEVHVTPWSSAQSFAYVHAQRRGA